MHPEFKKWLIADSKGWTLEQKRNFLKMLKFKPDQVVQIVSANLVYWGTIFCLQTGTPLIVGGLHDAQELLEAYREHFATELDAVTQ